MAAGDTTTSIPGEIKHFLQSNSVFLGVVRDVKDPEGRGRVKVECPNVNHTGKNNWIEWCEVLSIPVSFFGANRL